MVEPSLWQKEEDSNFESKTDRSIFKYRRVELSVIQLGVVCTCMRETQRERERERERENEWMNKLYFTRVVEKTRGLFTSSPRPWGKLLLTKRERERERERASKRVNQKQKITTTTTHTKTTTTKTTLGHSVFPAVETLYACISFLCRPEAPKRAWKHF